MATATASRDNTDFVVPDDRVKRVNKMMNSVKKATDVHKPKSKTTSTYNDTSSDAYLLTSYVQLPLIKTICT